MADEQVETTLAPPLPPGTKLRHGAFTIAKVLGQSPFGIAYMAHDRQSNSLVAIKELVLAGCTRIGHEVQPRDSLDPKMFQYARQKFFEDGRALTRLQKTYAQTRFHHEGLVSVLSSFEENNTAYMVMEHLRGKPLAQLVETRGRPFTEREAIVYIQKIGEALQELPPTVHRDIKPENVMICDDDQRVVFTGFGTVADLIKDEQQRRTIIMTSPYASLEEALPRGKRGSSSEVYALAAMLYHLLAAQAPPLATQRAAGAVLPDLQELNPHVSEHMAQVVMEALSLEPSKRPQNVTTFIDHLLGRTSGWSEETQAGATISASAPTYPDEFAPTRTFVQRYMPGIGKSKVNCVAFSPDGHYLASGSDNHDMDVWKVTDTGAAQPVVRKVSVFSGHSGSVRSVAYSPDGKLLASGSGDDTVSLWDIASGSRLWSRHWISVDKEIAAHGGTVNWVTAVAFSPTVPQRAPSGWNASGGPMLAFSNG
ncbi:MAG: serine/threonine-protein kinase, partial [Armatimonadota bacterium]|nr:serine/threonine-protein kinase [Armatimonadota bacterium]